MNSHMGYEVLTCATEKKFYLNNAQSDKMVVWVEICHNVFGDIEPEENTTVR